MHPFSPTQTSSAARATPRLEGVVVPIATPVTRSGAIDFDGLEHLANWLVSKNIHGIFVGGTTGRFSDFCPAEMAEMCRVLVDAFRDRVTIYGGICDSGERRILDNADRMAKSGADVLVTAGPYYLSRTIAEVEATLERVADRSPLPLVYYNLPEFVGYSLRPEWIGDMADHSNVAGYKDSSNDLDHHYDVLAHTAGKSFSVLIGKELLLRHALQRGAKGVVVSLVMADPDPFIRLVGHAAASDWDGAEKEQICIRRLFEECMVWFREAPAFSALMRYLEHKLAQSGMVLKFT